ncbi:hypothetical protein IMG5_093060 [Ichthyophthirius multifiliis]|uniref:EF-hand domain-containing protein n=1 Tax=Ichthyophthirius multifiliis TaxID=5932 RepID=G0QRH6_ICHMU|nr:hypothetical protein IMG5_093060 [Ichthyophthirius multifiliis]EGR32182.1 hypothetical protein IMG5_093060 [Ichthyophthirius multifiliis]|eukprot:XP_004035668.1 hypothetical protein IMG5_093060 [Ichthyophthirius multifiliis]
MRSIKSANSLVSQKSQKLLNNLVQKGQTNYPLQQGIQLDEDVLQKTWQSFGLYISRQMRMGRGIQIPHFGIFTFSAPDCNLNGVTNPTERDKQYRIPIFLVSKQFVKGQYVKTGIFIDGHLRPFNVQTNGLIQTAQINWTEISMYADQNKETVKIAFERIIRSLADLTRKQLNVDMEIPAIGVFQVRNNIAAVAFYESHVSTTKKMPNRPLSERKKVGESKLTSQNLQILDKKTTLEPEAYNYLKESIGLNIDDLKNKQRRQSNTINNTSKRPFSSINSRQSAIVLNQPELSNLQYSLKRLKFWIRQNCFNAQDAFLEICNNAIGRSKYNKVRINFDQFLETSNKIDLQLNEEQAKELFNLIDQNKDGYITYQDWKQIIKDDNYHLNYIQDVIYKRQLHTDDVLKTMGLDRENPPISLIQLKNSLKKLDLTLTDQGAFKVAKGILQEKDQISMQDLARILDCKEEDDKTFDPSWFKDILFKLKQKMIHMDNPNELKNSFENYDEHNEGILDTANFKTCLMRSQLRLSVKEINRIVRYLPKVNQNNVDYYHFLKLVKRVDISASAPDFVSDTNEFAQKLGKYIQDKKFTIPSFLKTIKRSFEDSHDVSLVQASQFLHQNIFKGNSKAQIEFYVNELDLDCDGFIKENDIELFLKRYYYFEQIEFAQSSQTRQYLQKTLDFYGENTTMNTKTLFPLENLNEKKVDDVIRDLRFKLQLKNMNYYELFNLLDSDMDGFITINEFSKNIDQIIKLSQAIKDGFFSYMDKLSIGMVDLNSFLKIMQKSLITKDQQIKEDSFDWETKMLQEIRNWFQKSGLTIEDSFRVLDRKFEGKITIEDLEVFLKECMKIKNEDLTQGILNRLFKLMDQFKNGRITLMDWKRFLLEDFKHGMNQSVMGHKKIDNFSSFDWKLNAKQQLGLVLTRRFRNLVQSFDSISGYKKHMIYSQLMKWIQETDALRGFDLSDRLSQELFADLDPHKKGFLTFSDWQSTFGGYNWNFQMQEELREYIKTNFESSEKAYEFFLQGKKQLFYSNFVQAVNYIMPKRFVESDLKDMWNILLKQEEIQQNVSFETFHKVFTLQRKQLFEKSSKYNRRPQTVGFLMNKTQKNCENEIEEDVIFEERLLEKIRRLLRPTIKNIQETLQKLDINNTGICTNLEFRNIIKSLELGLNMTEIDLLLNLCQIDGTVNIQKVIELIKPQQMDKKIVQRSTTRLRNITNQVYSYFLSPKDAFRIFDQDHLGYLNFDQFQNFISKVSQYSQTEMPPFSIIKDMFEYIDKKRDGVLDLTEWMDVFSKFEYVSQASIYNFPLQQANIYNTNMRPNTQQNIMKQKSKRLEVKDSQYNKSLILVRNKHEDFFDQVQRQPLPQPIQNNKENIILGDWEKSKQFDKILISIGKNRKFLMDMFSSLYQRNIPVTYDIAKQIIGQMLQSSGQKVKEEGWPILLKFAEKNGIIDYRFLLEVYKDRIQKIDGHPIKLQKN